jgi:hypothetical protein
MLKQIGQALMYKQKSGLINQFPGNHRLIGNQQKQGSCVSQFLQCQSHARNQVQLIRLGH